MAVNTDYPTFNYENCLSGKQKKSFQHLSKNLQTIFNERLLNSKLPKNISLARLVLDVYGTFKEEALPPSIDSFFLSLLKKPLQNCDETVSKLLEMTQKGLGHPIFKCASTDKEIYYPSDTLVKIINIFHSIIQNRVEPLPPLNVFPPFDKGGEALLDRLQQYPEELDQLKGLQPSQEASPVTFPERKPIPDEEEVTDLINRFKGDDLLLPLDDATLDKIDNYYRSIQRLCQEWKQFNMTMLVEKAAIVRNKEHLNENDLLELLVIGRLGLRLHFDVYLPPRLILALLGELLHPHGAVTKIVNRNDREMSLLLLSFVVAMQEKKVHLILSSNHFLNEIETNYEQFFRSFGLTASSIHKTREAFYFRSNILYGTQQNIQQAICDEMISSRKLFEEKLPTNDTDKRFDCAIIDEIKVFRSPQIDDSPLSLSPAVFFHMYNTIYGFSEKLETEIDPEEIEEIYPLRLFDTPDSTVPIDSIDSPSEMQATGKMKSIARATIERYAYSTVQLFFCHLDYFRRLLSNERFLDNLAHFLNDRKLIALSKTTPKIEDPLTPEILQLLTTRSTETLRWKLILKEIGETIIKLNRNNFFTNFYEPQKILLQNSILYSTTVEADQEEVSAEVTSLKSAIDEYSNQINPLRELGLHLSGSGIIDYLRLITGLSLPQMISSNNDTLEFQDSVENAIPLSHSFPTLVSFINQPLPPLPAEGITVGLPNTYQTCWLNTTLKFITCTTYYDQMLTDEPPPGKKELYDLLRSLVFLLRSGTEVPDNLYQHFLAEIQQQFGGIFTIGKQHDAPEFLLALTNALKWKPTFVNPQDQLALNDTNRYPRLGIAYQPIQPLPAGWGKYAKQENGHTHIEVTIPSHAQEGSLNLSTLINAAEIVELNPDKLNPDMPLPEVRNLAFRSSTHFTCLPDTFMVYLKRHIADENRPNAEGDIVRRTNRTPLHLDQNQFITLIKHGVVTNTIHGIPRITSMLPVERCRYRIGASMTHIGTDNKGHYICEERSANGRLTSHSDTSLTTIPIETFGQQAYFFRLDLVDRTHLTS